jgi:1-deoxy-D-xylulose 5-phosphate reductoisomerase
MGGYKILKLTGEEIMLKEHGETLKQHEERISAVEKQQQEYNIRQEALKNDVQAVSLSQQDLKMTIERVGLDLKEQNTKLFDHVLGKDLVKTQQEGALSLAKMSMKEKVLVALFGAGGLSGIIAAAVTFLGK